MADSMLKINQSRGNCNNFLKNKAGLAKMDRDEEKSLEYTVCWKSCEKIAMNPEGKEKLANFAKVLASETKRDFLLDIIHCARALDIGLDELGIFTGSISMAKSLEILPQRSNDDQQKPLHHSQQYDPLNFDKTDSSGQNSEKKPNYGGWLCNKSFGQFL